MRFTVAALPSIAGDEVSAFRPCLHTGEPISPPLREEMAVAVAKLRAFILAQGGYDLIVAFSMTGHIVAGVRARSFPIHFLYVADPTHS